MWSSRPVKTPRLVPQLVRAGGGVAAGASVAPTASPAADPRAPPARASSQETDSILSPAPELSPSSIAPPSPPSGHGHPSAGVGGGEVNGAAGRGQPAEAVSELSFLEELPAAEQEVLRGAGIKALSDLAGLTPRDVGGLLGLPSVAFTVAWQTARDQLISAGEADEGIMPISRLFPRRLAGVSAAPAKGGHAWREGKMASGPGRVA